MRVIYYDMFCSNCGREWSIKSDKPLYGKTLCLGCGCLAVCTSSSEWDEDDQNGEVE